MPSRPDLGTPDRRNGRQQLTDERAETTVSGPPRARLLRAAKAGEAIATPPARLVSKAVFEAGQTADALLDAARREAEAIGAAARAPAEAIKGEVAERAGAARPPRVEGGVRGRPDC